MAVKKSIRTRAEAKPKVVTAQVDGYQAVTDKMIAALEAGVVPWHKPWAASGLPRSMSTGKVYRGVNPILLGITAQIEGYASPFWGTYKQITEQGGQVRRGEKGSLITFWKQWGKKVQDEATQQWETKTIMILKTFVVFNLEQADWADGVPKKFVTVAPTEHEAIEAAEAILTGYVERKGAPGFAFDGGDRAYYRPSTDSVHIPARTAFGSAEALYSTAFHEFGHSTGHASRLARKGVTENHFFGDASYAQEELVAEMTAAFLCGASGIEQTHANSASYLANWLEVLRGDKRFVLQAASQAQKAADLVLGIAAAATDTEVEVVTEPEAVAA